jgi:Tfp pilus assembly protein PilP
MPSYTLIGVLDLGDRSTAMFDMNGSVQSVGLGKVIGNTGWTLARVSQQEVVAKRGKETKTIFVGQKF